MTCRCPRYDPSATAKLPVSERHLPPEHMARIAPLAATSKTHDEAGPRPAWVEDSELGPLARLSAAAVASTPMLPAEALRRIAFLLEAEGEASYKSRAFRRAAEAVEAVAPSELEELRSRRQLASLPGLGPTTAAVVSECLAGSVPGVPPGPGRAHPGWPARASAAAPRPAPRRPAQPFRLVRWRQPDRGDGPGRSGPGPPIPRPH